MVGIKECGKFAFRKTVDECPKLAGQWVGLE
jgi:hypothetical protein